MTDNPTQTNPGAARVTIAVIPRERWGLCEESLQSIRDHTKEPYELVYVDGGMPEDIKARVRSVCDQAGYRFIPSKTFLSPNEARNIGARAARGEYVVFIDNDVMVQEGWLSALVQEADESGAEVVAPITCQGLPLHAQIHQAGGTFAASAETFFAQPRGERRIVEDAFLQRTDISDPEVPRAAFDTQLVEFHCVMARRDMLERMGWLDEGMLATKEHLDFCMSVIAAGGRIRVEPRSVVTYVFPCRAKPMSVGDYPYFALRWSPKWQKDSLEHFQKKWGIGDEEYFSERMDKIYWRHMEGIIRPTLNRVPYLRKSGLWHKAGGKVMRGALRLMSSAMARRHAQHRREA